MSLKERMMSDLKAAMKNADSFKVGILRLIMSALQNEEIALRGKGITGEMDDASVIAVLKREAKKRKESIAIYGEAKRDDLKEGEEKELVVIQEYLPPELPVEEVKKVVEAIVASGDKEFSSVMKKAIAELKGQADGKVVSDIVRSLVG